MQKSKNIFLLSEPGHTVAYEKFLAGNPSVRDEECVVIPLDAEVEYALTKKGVRFESGRAFRTDNADCMVLSEEWSLMTLESKQWLFFTYREVSLSKIYFLPLQVYLTSLIYYADIVSNIIARYPLAERLIVFPSAQMTPPTGFSLEGHRITTLVDVVTSFAGQSNKEVLVPHVTKSVQLLTHRTFFESKRMLFGWGISVLNLFTLLSRRPRRIRILASDYWRNIAPYIKHINSVEVTLIDRKEAFNAGLSNIFKFRMRFLHLDAFGRGTYSGRELAHASITKEWQSVLRTLPLFEFHGFSLQSLLKRALDGIVDDAVSSSLKDIDAAYVLLERLKPDVVELRTTVSVQTHVGILAQVARIKHIPSLEMQHGLEYYGAGSVDRHHRAEFMGVYGKLVQTELQEAGDGITSVPIGSPRFDVYTYPKHKKVPGKPTTKQTVVFLCVAPAVLPGMATDTYDVEEYFKTIGSALREIPNASAVIKLRQGGYRESFYRGAISTAFGSIPHTIADIEPLRDLYAAADIVVSCYSTAVLEALQCGKPLVYLGLSAGERLMGDHHFAGYAKRGAIRIAANSEELARTLKELAADAVLREVISHKAKVFLEQEYAFDGKASERAAALITSLAFVKPR